MALTIDGIAHTGENYAVNLLVWKNIKKELMTAIILVGLHKGCMRRGLTGFAQFINIFLLSKGSS